MPVFDLTVIDYFSIAQSNSVSTELVLDAYGTLEQANIYFDNRLRSQSWKRSLVSDKKAALIEATDLIDRLNFAGYKAVDSQARQFPRNGDASVPSDIEKACYEVALKLLDGYDTDMEIDNLQATHQIFATVRNYYDRTWNLDHIRAGIPSAKAWEFLKPYLVDPNAISIIRIN